MFKYRAVKQFIFAQENKIRKRCSNIAPFEREREKTPRAVPRIDSQEVPKSLNFVPKIPEFRDFFSADHLLPSRFLLKGWLVFSLNAQRINERRRKYATEHLRLLRILPFFSENLSFSRFRASVALFRVELNRPIPSLVKLTYFVSHF